MPNNEIIENSGEPVSASCLPDYRLGLQRRNAISAHIFNNFSVESKRFTVGKGNVGERVQFLFVWALTNGHLFSHLDVSFIKTVLQVL